MLITETKLKGAFVIELKRFEDVRGFFAQSWSEREFADAGLSAHWVESNLSFNKEPGTLRGMHYQAPPFGQIKLVRCTRGSIYDVFIDLRPQSETFKQWFGVKLSADNHRMLYIPGEFAHGYQTLEKNTEVFYQTSARYAPDHADGVRWNDPAFNITWPDADRIIIERDRDYPDFTS